MVAHSCPTLCNPMDCSLSGSSVHEDSPGKNTGVGCRSLLQENLPNPGFKPTSHALQADSLPSELPGKLMEVLYSLKKKKQLSLLHRVLLIKLTKSVQTDLNIKENILTSMTERSRI